MRRPIVVGELLVLTAFEDGKLYTIAYRRADGGEAWRAEAPAEEIEPFYAAEGSPAASTCATDGERIASYFGSCGLIAYDSSGKQLWKFSMPPASTIGGFGSGTSPVIADGVVILVRDELNEPKIVAVDLASGKAKWESKRQSNSSFSTPAIWDTPQGMQIVAPGFGRMIGYDFETGDEKWFVDGMPSGCCTTPVTHDGELLFAGWSPGDPSEETEFKMPTYDDFLKEGDANKDGVLSKEESVNTSLKDFFDTSDADRDGLYTREESEALRRFMEASRNSAFALKPGGTGDVTASHMLWKKTNGLPYVASAIVYGGQFVMVKDGGIVTAYHPETGKRLYQKRVAESGNYYASPVAASGHIYLTSLADGVVTVLKAGTNPPELVAKNPPLGELAATPAIAGNTLYMRTAGHLYALAE